jgi:hypothetical protein
MKKIALPDKKQFLELYLSQNNSQLAAYYQVSTATIKRWAKHFEFRRHPSLPNALTQDQSDLIVGSLLGDGYLSKIYPQKRIPNSYFGELHGKNQKAYLKAKYDFLLPFSRKFYTSKKYCNIFGRPLKKWYTRHWMETYCSPIFTQLEQKWYKRNQDGEYELKNGKRIKLLPLDFKKITPLSLVIWYFDDGSWQNRQVRLHTEGFSIDEVRFLQHLLNQDLGIGDTSLLIARNKPLISINRGSFFDFMDIITQHNLGFPMQYKIAI